MHASFKMKLRALGLGLLWFTIHLFIEDVLCFLIVNYNTSPQLRAIAHSLVKRSKINWKFPC